MISFNQCQLDAQSALESRCVARAVVIKLIKLSLNVNGPNWSQVSVLSMGFVSFSFISVGTFLSSPLTGGSSAGTKDHSIMCELPSLQVGHFLCSNHSELNYRKKKRHLTL